jgi:hypothetical protein
MTLKEERIVIFSMEVQNGGDKDVWVNYYNINI